MTKPRLTPKQKDVLKYIYRSIRQHNLPPTIREIAREFGFSSTGTVRDYLKALVTKGYIRITANKSRAIEGYLNLDSLLFSDESAFALRVRGDSMNGAGIMPDDLVLVRRQSVAQTGETVVALVEDEATVKYLQRQNGGYVLQAANPAYAPIPVDENVSIIGKVISVVRRYG